ncbi:MAG: hypothetical protein WCR39_03825, partial [Bacteroidales bacterium]
MNSGYRINTTIWRILLLAQIAWQPLCAQDQDIRRIHWQDALTFDVGHYPEGAGTLPRYSERLPWGGS